MKGKRRIGAALLLIFCLVAAAALAIDGNATNGTPFVTHEHNWIRPTVVREATCSSTGIRRYYCTGCGQTKEETILPSSSYTIR